MVFCISVASVVTSPFSFCLFGFLPSPLLGESSQRFVYFVYLFKEPALGLMDFFYCFLNLYFIDFLLDLYDYLPSADFRFCLFFFNSFRWWVQFSIWDFSSLSRKTCVAMNFPLSTAPRDADAQEGLGCSTTNSRDSWTGEKAEPANPKEWGLKTHSKRNGEL